MSDRLLEERERRDEESKRMTLQEADARAQEVCQKVLGRLAQVRSVLNDGSDLGQDAVTCLANLPVEELHRVAMLAVEHGELVRDIARLALRAVEWRLQVGKAPTAL